MKPAEQGIVDDDSEFYIYTPSATARTTFLYPLRVGIFHDLPGYWQERSSFDSFLIMAVLSGSMQLHVPSGDFAIGEGQLALVDCYARHAYGTSEDTTLLWLHFDGVMARPYFELITRDSPIIRLKDPTYAINRLRQIYMAFHTQQRIVEATMSKLICDILTECVLAEGPEADESRRQPQIVEEVLSYISTHLSEPLTIGDLAARAYMSEYHFIRVFKRQTGYTPHAYIVEARIHAAKYLLANGDAPLKRICAECGFSDSSVLCATFKRKTGLSPMEYRMCNRPSATSPLLDNHFRNAHAGVPRAGQGDEHAADQRQKPDGVGNQQHANADHQQIKYHQRQILGESRRNQQR